MNERIRADFPMLRQQLDGMPLIYLDSAATSLKPAATLAAQRDYETLYTANVHRGVSSVGDRASFEYESARGKIAGYIGADPACVILTPNTSYALALVAGGLRLSADDTVLCAANNHHSNLLPWMRRAKVIPIRGNPLQPIDPDDVRIAVKTYRPRAIAFGWVSNVNGVVSPAAEICRIAREHQVISVVDAAQAAPHLPIDVSTLGSDFLAFSGHKMLGPTGTGILWGRKEILETLEPQIPAGGTVDHVTFKSYKPKPLPHRLEPGTPHIAGVIGLGAAVEYLARLGHETIQDLDRRLSAAMHDAFAELPAMRVLAAEPGCPHIAISSLVPRNEKLSSDFLCRCLSDSFKIMTRPGFHCAHPLFESQGFSQGAVRLSAYIYNTIEEIGTAARAIDTVVRRLGG